MKIFRIKIKPCKVISRLQLQMWPILQVAQELLAYK